MNVAVDAMGGDFAPQVVVQGAVEAASELGITVTLVGNGELIEKELDYLPRSESVSVHHCDDFVLMDEEPLRSVRQKKDSSIRVAFDLVKREMVDAVVSAGNSGATLAAGVLVLGRMKGVDRPAIASVFPGLAGDVLLIDAGANVDCRPSHLFQFALMAEAFASSCLGMENPRIALLSIGEEDVKGNEQVKLARELLEKGDLNFIGNVEGRNVFTGEADIIVCDGFVGNVALKIAEGVADAMISVLFDELEKRPEGRKALEIAEGCFDRFRGRFNYEGYGGAPLLGINGVGIICHGGSSTMAMKNGIRLAASYVEKKVHRRMMERFRSQAV